ncbi:hypothetical protein BCR35DRAFT_332665 [Leucosporidium creatinivorum]|uniref:AMP-dependent synthetase/ligase domain-containing protein n=1 Tax=Leucosporidium creatinivorum TaxID=106004 RepID=A0A1Y2EZ45_9BASI|nr:hypothetical protein BCR35DRAFT_332665 [Leucosporidium creatinivorum]
MTASSASPSSLGPIPECTIVQYILSNPHQVPLDKVIKIEAEGDRQLTYKDFCDSIMDVASGIRSELPQLAEGDFAFILSPNTFMLPSLILGIMGRGFVPVAIVASSSPAEIRHALTLVAPEGPKVIFVHPSLLAIAEKVIEELSLSHPPQLVLVTATSDGIKLLNLDDLIKSGKEHPQPIAELRKPAKESLAAIYFSSGTTGPPKAVQTSHLQFMASTRVCMAATPYLFEPEGRLLSFLPLALGYGQLTSILLPTLKGTPNVLSNRFSLPSFLAAIQKYRITALAITPPVCLLLAQEPLVDDFDLSSLRDIMTAGSSTRLKVMQTVKRRLGANVWNGLGMTETFLSINPPLEIKEPNGSVGRPCPGVEVKSVDDEGVELGDEEVGELIVKSPCCMTMGYLRNEKATKETIRDGWIYTGDLARRSKDGFYFMLDRKSEIVHVDGHDVAPSKLEAILLLHPLVHDAGVAKVNGPHGEVPRAFVVVDKENHSPSTAQHILDFVNEQVEPSQRLVGGVCFVDEIPKRRA